MRSLGLVVVALAVAAGAVEAILAAFPVPAIEIHRRRPETRREIFFTYEPTLGWRGRANAAGRLEGWEFSTAVRLNSRGFRDREVGTPKPAGGRRLLVLGDSITWGHGVEQTERYSDLLADRLGPAGHAVEVVNMAMSGYATDQQLLLFERVGRDACADLVLLGLYGNDPGENASLSQGPYPKPRFRLAPGGELILENVPVPRVADSVTAAAPPESGLKRTLRERVRLYAALAFARESVRRAWAAEPPPPAIAPEAVELTAALLRRVAAAVRDSGGRFLVLVLPDRVRTRATADAAARSGVGAVLDLTPAFAATGAWDALFQRLDGAHWTARGHAVAADAIARYLLDRRLLSSPPRRCA